MLDFDHDFTESNGQYFTNVANLTTKKNKIRFRKDVDTLTIQEDNCSFPLFRQRSRGYYIENPNLGRYFTGFYAFTHQWRDETIQLQAIKFPHILLPADTITFYFKKEKYQIYSTSNVQSEKKDGYTNYYIEDEDDDDLQKVNLQLTQYTANGKQTTEFYSDLEYFNEDAGGTGDQERLFFYGDIDYDGKLDLIYYFLQTYSVCLSKPADKDQVVKQVWYLNQYKYEACE